MGNEKMANTSSMAAQHLTTISYPAIHDINTTTEVFELHPIQNSEQRYKPRPLIPDTAVTAHAFRESYDETLLFSTATVTRNDHEGKLNWNYLPPPSDEFRLLRNMDEAQEKEGLTQLHVVTYRLQAATQNHAAGTSMVRIIQGTRHFVKPGVTKGRLGLKYDIRVQVLLKMNPTDRLWLANVDRPWLTSIVDIVTRRTDRAVLYVQGALQRMNLQDRDIETEWKKDRHPNYKDMLGEPTKADATQEEGQSYGDCPICREEVVDMASLAMPCQAKHFYHRDCLLLVCEAEPLPENVRCPLCRQAVFQDQKQLDLLKFGVVDGVFHNDDQFNHWENFERSCADLDQRLISNEESDVKVNRNLLLAVFDHISHGALKEPASSTPYLLQPSRCTDFKHFRRMFEEFFDFLPGLNFNVKWIHKQFFKDFEDKLRATYGNPRNGFPITNNQHDRTIRDRTRTRLFMTTPGLLEHAERTLNRVIRFCQLRECDCADGAERALHLHGGRMYFSWKAFLHKNTDHESLHRVRVREMTYMWVTDGESHSRTIRPG